MFIGHCRSAQPGAIERHPQNCCLKLEFVDENSESSSLGKRTHGFYNQQVIRQILHSQSQVEVSEAVIEDRLYLFLDLSPDDDEIQIDHSYNLSLVICDCCSQLSISSLVFVCPLELKISFVRTVSATLFGT